MAKLVLVRHAQASLTSDNYDQLSKLGYQQSELLGKHLANISLKPDQLICGSLQRHIETTEIFSSSLPSNFDLKIDERWNEFDFKTLLRTYIANHYSKPIAFNKNTEPKEFFIILKRAMHAWANGKLADDQMESWEDFSARILGALNDILSQTNKSDVVVITSSGGAISMALRHILDLNSDKLIDINFQIKNASFSSFEIKKDRFVLSSFNQTPHLELTENGSLVTYA